MGLYYNKRPTDLLRLKLQDPVKQIDWDLIILNRTLLWLQSQSEGKTEPDDVRIAKMKRLMEAKRRERK